MHTLLQLLLPLLLLELSCYQLCHSALTVTVPAVRIKLKATENELGLQYSVDNRVSISLNCYVTSNIKLENPQVTWYQQNATTELSSQRFTIAGSLSADKKNYTSTLTIKVPSFNDVSGYICSAKETGLSKVTALGQIQSIPLLMFSDAGTGKVYSSPDLSIWPDEQLKIRCQITNYPAGSVQWRKDGNTIASGEVLQLRKVTYESNRGNYECFGSNALGNNSAVLFLRVKNSQAYLVPLLILIAEILFVAAIVGLYEFKRYRERQRDQAQLQESKEE